MIVVSDTSPLNYLARIQRLDLFPAVFGSVVIPQAVAAELSHAAAPSIVRELVGNRPSWLEIRAAVRIDPALKWLGRGEAEAIILAEELRADFLLVDDLDARREAAQRRLRLTGTLGVLELAARRGLVDLAGSIAQLRAIGFRISESAVQEILRRASR